VEDPPPAASFVVLLLHAANNPKTASANVPRSIRECYAATPKSSSVWPTKRDFALSVSGVG